MIHTNKDLSQDEADFSTTTIPSGLLGACKVSRGLALERLNVCIESKTGEHKIRVDGMNDEILLYPCKSLLDKDKKAPFAQHVGNALNGVITVAWRGLEGTNWYMYVRTIMIHAKSPRTLIWVINAHSDVVQKAMSGKNLSLKSVEGCESRGLEVIASGTVNSCWEWILSYVRLSLEEFKKDQKPDWDIPEIQGKVLDVEGGAR